MSKLNYLIHAIFDWVSCIVLISIPFIMVGKNMFVGFFIIPTLIAIIFGLLIGYRGVTWYQDYIEEQSPIEKEGSINE